MRRAAHIVLLLTGALLLVLSLLPHHHHGKAIHFSLTPEHAIACPGCSETECEKHDWCDEQGEKRRTDAECDLRQLFVISTREEYLAPTCSDAGFPSLLGEYCLLTLLFDGRPAPQLTSLAPPPCPAPADPLASLCSARIFAHRGPPSFIA